MLLLLTLSLSGRLIFSPCPPPFFTSPLFPFLFVPHVPLSAFSLSSCLFHLFYISPLPSCLPTYTLRSLHPFSFILSPPQCTPIPLPPNLHFLPSRLAILPFPSHCSSSPSLFSFRNSLPPLLSLAGFVIKLLFLLFLPFHVLSTFLFSNIIHNYSSLRLIYFQPLLPATTLP